MENDTARLEEKLEFLGRQLTSTQMEARKLRDEVTDLKEVIVEMTRIMTGHGGRKNVSE